ncbi:VQ motif [Musa troglodytarum]|uniref:VQ motif n=1 Tax=Musa troglodytarum TaxID=320322 RepID=A0A9E7GC52_9LILI|nr:VQ motif [Musa troglodytarum]
MALPRRQSPRLGMKDSSHAITKPKPEIRIIHVFEPEIMKTDAANFRELVQRLTGKPVAAVGGKKKKKDKKLIDSKHDREKRTSKEEVKQEELEEEERMIENTCCTQEEMDDFLQVLSGFPLSSPSSSRMDVLGN